MADRLPAPEYCTGASLPSQTFGSAILLEEYLVNVVSPLLCVKRIVISRVPDTSDAVTTIFDLLFPCSGLVAVIVQLSRDIFDHYCICLLSVGCYRILKP